MSYKDEDAINSLSNLAVRILVSDQLATQLTW